MTMQQNTEDPLFEKILSDLYRAIKRHPVICEFDIIPSATAQRNTSPVVHVDTFLALESWCVKQMFTYITNIVTALRRSKIKTFDTNRLNRLLIGGLLINPDVTTFWNIRRELVLDMSLDIRDELHICKLVISFKPKSNESFMYREWLLQRLIKINDMTNIDANGQLHSLIIDELDIASKAIEKASNNYHATNYKLFLMRQLAPIMLNFEMLLQRELNRSEVNMSKSVSDSSVYFYRQQIINIIKEVPITLDDKYTNQFHLLLKQNSWNNSDKINDMLIIVLGKPPSTKWSILRLNCLSNLLKILIYELSYISELNTMFPCHETIWYHRRYVLYELLSILYSFYDLDLEQNCLLTNKNRQICSSENITDLSYNSLMLKNNLRSDDNRSLFDCILLFKVLIENEKKELECCSRDLTQTKFVDRHKKWLLLNFNLAIM